MKKKNFLLEMIEVIGVSLVISYLLFHFVLISARVNGTSMYPTLEDGDFGYSFVITRNMGISRFDTCVVDVEGKKLVKRVIGMPNEIVECISGVIYINGEILEDVVDPETYTSDFAVVLRDDEYYCLGDNREVSRDSRYYGPFKEKDIVSTHLFVIYPLDKFGYKK